MANRRFDRNTDGRGILLVRLMLQYGIVVIMILFYVTAVSHFDYTPDDTYIYLQYARNLAEGHGFAFNAGTPSYGITGPLWTLLIASGVKLGLDPYIVAKTIDLLAASAAILMFFILSFTIIRDRLYALVAAWMFSFDAWFLRWTATGMETSAALLLCLLTAWYAYRKEYFVASFVAGLFTLVRPEGAILFALVLLDLFLNTADRLVMRRALRRSCLAFGLVVGAWFVFAAIHFGGLVPNTLQAKSTAGGSFATLLSTAFSALKITGATQALTVVLAGVGVWITLRRDGWPRLREDVFPILWIAALPLFYIAFNVQVVSRYLLLTTPFIVLFGVWGLKRLEATGVLSPARGVQALLILAGLSLAQNQILYRSQVVPHMNNFVTGMNESLKPIAYWLRTHAPDGSSVLTPDVGLLSYVSGKTFYETAGLVTPQVKKAFDGVSYDEGMIQRRYERAIRPDYIVDRSPVPERLESDSIQAIMTRPFFGLGLTKPDPVYYTLYEVRE